MGRLPRPPRFQQVRTLAAAVEEASRSWAPSAAPGWARPLLYRDPRLLAHLAVWRAAQRVADDDPALTGPAQRSAADLRAQHALDDHAESILGDPAGPARQWAPLADAIDPRLRADPYWPQLADRLSAAARAGIDITTLTTRVAAERPLPDEMPAAALWWRLAAHLSPAALDAAGTSAPDTLRPAWTPTLASILGDATDRVVADHSWPALVAAVTTAGAAGWTPGDALRTAHDLLTGGAGDDTPLPADQLTQALAWRVRLLCDPSDPSAPPPPDDPPPLDEPDDEVDERPSAADVAWLHAADPGRRTPAPPRPDTTDADGHAEPDPWLAALTARLAGRHQGDTPPPAGPDSFATNPATAVPGQPEIWHRDPTRDRLLELNRQAAGFFTDRYPGSWASGYLHQRLGTDLRADPRFTPGYAPAGWTTLVSHLSERGAGPDELLDAGLATRARNGRLIDRFRDRLVLPIRDVTGDVVGFVARRPEHAGDEHGPKYLNTPDTAVFRKGDCLYGPANAGDALADGATPVLVEGPFDAMAVTLAGDGQYVGLAPLGTAFTDSQADQLRADLRPGTIVATDNDPAGRVAAIRSYWRLVARGDTPRQLLLPDGLDPAALLYTAGAAGLRDALHANTRPLVHAVIDERINRYASRLHTVEGVVLATRGAAQAIAALPPEQWPQHIPYVTSRVNPLPGTTELEVLDAAEAWTDDQAGVVRRRLAEQLNTPPPPGSADPTQRWLPLANAVDPRLPGDPHWAALAGALDRAYRAGYDVLANLPRLATQPPLPERHTARTLHTRLTAETEAAITPLPASPGPSTVIPDAAQPAGRLPTAALAPHRPVQH